MGVALQITKKSDISKIILKIDKISHGKRYRVVFYWFTGVSANNLQCPQPQDDDDDDDHVQDDDMMMMRMMIVFLLTTMMMMMMFILSKMMLMMIFMKMINKI